MTLEGAIKKADMVASSGGYWKMTPKECLLIARWLRQLKERNEKDFENGVAHYDFICKR